MKVVIVLSNNCPRCLEVAELLRKEEIPFEYVDIRTIVGGMRMLDVLEEAGVTKEFESPSMPIMVQDKSIWTGEDCLIAVEEDEIELES